jgi:hypothetical protein
MHSKPDNSVSLRSVANPCYTAQPELKTIALFRILPTDRPLQSVKATASTQVSKRFTTLHGSLHCLNFYGSLQLGMACFKPFTMALSGGL